LQQPEAARLRETARVDGDEDVGRAVGALRLHPLDQLLVGAVDDIDLDTRRLGELVPKLLVGAVMARVVDVDDFGGVSRMTDRQRKGSGQQNAATG